MRFADYKLARSSHSQLPIAVPAHYRLRDSTTQFAVQADGFKQYIATKKYRPRCACCELYPRPHRRSSSRAPTAPRPPQSAQTPYLLLKAHHSNYNIHIRVTTRYPSTTAGYRVYPPTSAASALHVAIASGMQSQFPLEEPICNIVNSGCSQGLSEGFEGPAELGMATVGVTTRMKWKCCSSL